MARYESIDAFLADLPRLTAGVRDRLCGQSGLFELTTKQGRHLFVRLDDGLITLPETAPAEKPDCVVTADERDLLAIANREQSPVTAILFGKVKVRGNRALLLKLAGIMIGA